MQVKMDSAGRIMVPKAFRESLGLQPGVAINLSMYGDGLHLAPNGRGGNVRQSNGRTVISGEGTFSDEMMFALIDSGRK
jgi:AbrB family looped-hinge helix DNA binding protein